MNKSFFSNGVVGAAGTDNKAPAPLPLVQLEEVPPSQAATQPLASSSAPAAAQPTYMRDFVSNMQKMTTQYGEWVERVRTSESAFSRAEQERLADVRRLDASTALAKELGRDLEKVRREGMSTFGATTLRFFESNLPAGAPKVHVPSAAARGETRTSPESASSRKRPRPLRLRSAETKEGERDLFESGSGSGSESEYGEEEGYEDDEDPIESDTETETDGEDDDDDDDSDGDYGVSPKRAKVAASTSASNGKKKKTKRIDNDERFRDSPNPGKGYCCYKRNRNPRYCHMPISTEHRVVFEGETREHFFCRQHIYNVYNPCLANGVANAMRGKACKERKSRGISIERTVRF